MCLMSFFFFKQKTAYEMRISDWSSDVCSSDLSWGRSPCSPEGQCVELRNQARCAQAAQERPWRKKDDSKGEVINASLPPERTRRKLNGRLTFRCSRPFPLLPLRKLTGLAAPQRDTTRKRLNRRRQRESPTTNST